MKRLHINLTTADLPRSIAFYNELFEQEPTVLKKDYAKWLLDNPRVNFALSTHGNTPGIDHLGIEAEAPAEFEGMRARLRDSANDIFEQPDVSCCYANSSKAWVRDPNGVAWETFISRGSVTDYGDGTTERAAGADEDTQVAGCCVAADEKSGSCCV